MAFTIFATLVVPYLVSIVSLGTLDPTVFIFLTPSLIFITPLYIVVFLAHLIFKNVIVPVTLLTTGTGIYLTVAIATLNAELYGSVVGHIYWPSLIILYIIGMWILLSDASMISKLSKTITDNHQ